MHEAALAQAALPAPTVILGMALRPYSIGHELLLIREANPILICDAVESVPTTTRADLAEAVLICCQSWEDNRGMVSDWLIGLKLAIWRRRTREANFQRELQGFIEYRASGQLEFPKSEVGDPTKGDPGRPPGAPFLLRLHQFLVMHYGKTEAQAWDYPLGLAKMRLQTFWEEEGGYHIKNYHEDDFDRYCQEEEAKEAAAEKLKARPLPQEREPDRKGSHA